MDPYESAIRVIPTAWHICTRRMVEILNTMVLYGVSFLTHSCPPLV